MRFGSIGMRKLVSIVALACLTSACGGLMSDLKEGPGRYSDSQIVQLQPNDSTPENAMVRSAVADPEAAQPNMSISQDTQVTRATDQDNAAVVAALRNILSRLDEQSAEIAGMKDMIGTKTSNEDMSVALRRMEAISSRTEALAGRLEMLEGKVNREAVIKNAAEAEPTGPFSGDGSAGAGRKYYGLHLGSFETIDALRPAWNEALAKYPSALSSYQPYFAQLDVKGVGIYYRLVAGPLSSEPAASRACAPIVNADGYCRVTTMAGEKVPL